MSGSKNLRHAQRQLDDAKGRTSAKEKEIEEKTDKISCEIFQDLLESIIEEAETRQLEISNREIVHLEEKQQQQSENLQSTKANVENFTLKINELLENIREHKEATRSNDQTEEKRLDRLLEVGSAKRQQIIKAMEEEMENDKEIGEKETAVTVTFQEMCAASQIEGIRLLICNRQWNSDRNVNEQIRILRTKKDELVNQHGMCLPSFQYSGTDRLEKSQRSFHQYQLHQRAVKRHVNAMFQELINVRDEKIREKLRGILSELDNVLLELGTTVAMCIGNIECQTTLHNSDHEKKLSKLVRSIQTKVNNINEFSQEREILQQHLNSFEVKSIPAVEQ